MACHPGKDKCIQLQCVTWCIAQDLLVRLNVEVARFREERAMHATKTLIVIRHGESEWNATPRPAREEFYFQQLAQAELQEAHNSKLLGT